ncbi:MAG: nucleotidyltransferase substrate binding protein [bacterium]|nr:nucleotidyltransferase substrate binding protein [bacterium]
MKLDASHLRRCVLALKVARSQLDRVQTPDTMHDVFLAACVKLFEMLLEQSGALLRRRLYPMFASHGKAQSLSFGDVFRFASKHGLISDADCERWLHYRVRRNFTAHEYGQDYAIAVMELLPAFVDDVDSLLPVIEREFNE